MSKNELRMSQLVGMFGPGSMVDLPTRSVMIGGLERWDMREGNWRKIDEPRLALKLEAVLQQRGELAGASLSLRTPPLPPQNRDRTPPGVAATIFPTWFVSERLETFMSGGREGRGRRLMPWSQLDADAGKRRYRDEAGKKVDVTPIRFVGACPDGHIQDLNWSFIVHGDGAKCGLPLWLEEQGTSGDPRDVTIACECGRSLSLVQASAPGRLGHCLGRRPWLEGDAAEGCDHQLGLLIRTATNTYFPQVATVISLPEADNELARLVQMNLDLLASVTSLEQLRMFRTIERLKAALEGYSDEAVLAALDHVRTNAAADGMAPIKVAEFDRLAQGDPEIGRNAPESRFYAETLAREAWDDGNPNLAFVENVVAVHRLREVAALYGFTRFEPAPTSSDGELEDVRLAVKGASLARQTEWLPAIEQFGEGVFLHISADAVRHWIEQPQVRARGDALRGAHEAWWSERGSVDDAPPAPGVGYVLLHSLSHALLTEIALDCGYPASAMKERVYALSSEKSGAPTRCGILIYTASPGAQGSLGGLAAVSRRLAPILGRALDRLAICSNDPVCADHEPGEGTSDRALLGAACHGCLLIAETSCEARNLYLDRSLLVETMAHLDCNFL